ncbi:anoctamin, partial [Thraustotheca clavata]
SEVPSVMTYAIPIFALFMCIWSTLFIESWKRQQSVLAMKWGMATVEEAPRQQFEGEPIASAITGVKTKYFPATKKMERVAMSWAFLILLCSIVLLIVAGIYRLRWLLSNDFDQYISGGILPKPILASGICSFANVVQIFIMGKIYYDLFYKLNDYENHETDSQYQRSLSRKTFVFQFINNFAGLMYIAFFKNYFEGASQERLQELALSLGIVFCSQLVIGNIKEIVLPRIWAQLKKIQIISSKPIQVISAAEEEFFLGTYEWSGTFDDFTEIIVQFGFCTLFVVAFPLTPLLSLINNYFEIRVDGYRLLYEYRRSRPRGACDIGSWLEIIEFMTTLAILTNGYVVVWTSNTFDFLEAKFPGQVSLIELYRNQAFMIFVAVLLAFRFFIAKLIDNSPDSVVAQIKRQLFFNNKVIYKIPDDVVKPFKRYADDHLDLTVRNSDYAIAFPGKPITIINKEQKSMEEVLQNLHNAEAQSINFPVLLDEIELEKVATAGDKENGINLFGINDEKHLYDYGPYQYIQATYEDDDHLQHLFAKRNLDNTIFTPVERMKLIESIMTSTTDLKLDALCANGCILAYYPLHNKQEIENLRVKWIPAVAVPWKQPLNEIRDYFGKRIAFYFGYLGHYTTWLIYLSVISVIVFAIQLLNFKSEVPSVMTYAIPIFALFMCIWSTLFIESWKRQQSVLAMKWGAGVYRFIFLLFVKHEIFHVTASFICSLANVVQIINMGKIYYRSFYRLNENENHETDSQYESSLARKTFVFQFINIFAGLMYIAFMKNYFEGQSQERLHELAPSLGVVFCSQDIIGTIREIVLPRLRYIAFIKQWWHSRFCLMSNNYGSTTNGPNYNSVILDINPAWDFIIAFKLIKGKQEDYELDDSSKEILHKLYYTCGLEFRLEKSSSGDIAFAFICCHEDKLKVEATRIQFPMLLDPKALEYAARNGFPSEGIFSFTLKNNQSYFNYPPYEYIYADFDDKIDYFPQYLAKRDSKDSIFTPVQRFKLFESILKSAKVDLDDLYAKGTILACYPLHNMIEINQLSKVWIPAVAAPWKQPLDRIRGYFGERIAFYFGYLGHYTTWLIFASILGIAVFSIRISTTILQNDITALDKNGTTRIIKSEAPSIMTFTIPIFAFLMCIWATLFMESWKRKQNVLAMKWGMSDFTDTIRTQFEGTTTQCEVTGGKTIHFPLIEKIKRVVISWTILILLCTIVLWIVAGIFRLQYVLSHKHSLEYTEGFLSRVPIGSCICSFANVVQIVIMGYIYTRTFHILNKYENHETETQYENSLIIKSFIFQFINNFSGLFYVAFLKNTFEGDSQDRLHELAFSLGIVFGSQLVFGNIKEIILPRIWVKWNYIYHGFRPNSDNDAVDGKPPVEIEYGLAVYDSNGTFDDYTEIVVQFGFCTLFVVAFPLTTCLSFLYNYIEIRVDGYRLLHENRRPRPRSARDIGIWLDIVEFMTTLAIFTNAYIVVWTSNTLDFLEAKYHDQFYLVELHRNQAFMVFVSILLGFRYILAKIIPDIPGSVVTQLKRQDQLVSRVIHRVPDASIPKKVYPREPYNITLSKSKYFGKTTGQDYGSTKSIQKTMSKLYDGSVAIDIKEDNDFWDFVLVLGFKNGKLDPDAEQFIQKLIVDLGLQFRFFQHQKNDIVFALLHCPNEKLESEAARIQFPLLLDSHELEDRAKTGYDGDSNVGPFELKKGLWDYHPYKYIHADYDNDKPEFQQLLPVRPSKESRFTPAQRFKLIESILESENLNLDECSNGVIAGFPLHDEDDKGAKKKLSDKWPLWCAFSWDQPLDDIRDYFGERIAFYFSYLGHYTTWLISVSIVGAIVFGIQLTTDTHDKLITIHYKNGSSITIASEKPSIMTYTIPIFAFFMCIWSTLFMETWKRKQNILAMQWGMSDLTEKIRPQHKDNKKQSDSELTRENNDNGIQSESNAAQLYCNFKIFKKAQKYLPILEKIKRFFISWTILILLCAMVLFLVAAMVRLHYILTYENPIKFTKGFLSHVPVTSCICSFVNVAQIVLMSSIYTRTYHCLTRYENHETETQYENSLIIKSFIFQFINNYSGLFYVAFLKNTFEGESQDRLHELAYSLGIVFMSQLVLGNIKEVALPRIWAWLKNNSINQYCLEWYNRMICCGCFSSSAAPTTEDEVNKNLSNEQSQAEIQYDLAVYDSNGTFDDYSEIVVQFGFCTLFVVAFPLATLLSFMYNYFEIRVDGYRLLRENRRPRPRSAKDIGIWLDILEVMATLAIFTNAYIVVWTSNTLDFLEAKYHGHIYLIELYRNQAFMVFVSILLGFRYLIAKLIPDVPSQVTTQLKRQEYLVSKAINRVPDTNKTKNITDSNDGNDNNSNNENNAQIKAVNVMKVDLTIYESYAELKQKFHLN